MRGHLGLRRCRRPSRRRDGANDGWRVRLPARAGGMAGTSRDLRGQRSRGRSRSDLRHELSDRRVRRVRDPQCGGGHVLLLVRSPRKRVRITDGDLLQGRHVHTELRRASPDDRLDLLWADGRRRLQRWRYAFHYREHAAEVSRAVRPGIRAEPRAPDMGHPGASLRAGQQRRVIVRHRWRVRGGERSRVRSGDALHRARGRVVVSLLFPETTYVLRIEHRHARMHTMHLWRSHRCAVRKRHSDDLSCPRLHRGWVDRGDGTRMFAPPGDGERADRGRDCERRRLPACGRTGLGYHHASGADDGLLHGAVMTPTRAR